MPEQLDKGAYGVRKMQCMGIFPVECSKGAFKLVETILRQHPELHALAASSVLSFLGSGKAKEKQSSRDLTA